MRATWVAVLGGFLIVSVARDARGDDWATPEKKFVKSESGRYRAVVTPRDGKRAPQITLYDDTQVTRPKKLYQRTAVNSLMPAQILVGDGGHVVTFDEWMAAGYRHALVIYDRKGKVVVDRSLEEILPPDDLSRVDETESSRWWRAKDHGVSLADGRLHVRTAWDATIQFDLRTGAQIRDGARFQVENDKQRFARLMRAAARGGDFKIELMKVRTVGEESGTTCLIARGAIGCHDFGGAGENQVERPTPSAKVDAALRALATHPLWNGDRAVLARPHVKLTFGLPDGARSYTFTIVIPLRRARGAVAGLLKAAGI